MSGAHHQHASKPAQTCRGVVFVDGEQDPIASFHFLYRKPDLANGRLPPVTQNSPILRHSHRRTSRRRTCFRHGCLWDVTVLHWRRPVAFSCSWKQTMDLYLFIIIFFDPLLVELLSYHCLCGLLLRLCSARTGRCVLSSSQTFVNMLMISS